jgi:hypothetical protein
MINEKNPSEQYAAKAQTLESADGLLIRPRRQGGFEVVIGFDRVPRRETPWLLAKSADCHALIEQAVAQFDREEGERHPPASREQPPAIGPAEPQPGLAGIVRDPHGRAANSVINPLGPHDDIPYCD